MAEITLAELIRKALDARLLDVHTSMPGVIETYDASKQIASVRPALSRVTLDADGERVKDALPVIQNVKVQWPFGGVVTGLGKRFFLHCPLDPGDGGLLVFSEAAFDHWRTGGGFGAPEDLRRHSLAAPIFLPGLAQDGSPLAPPAGKMALGLDGGERVAFDPAGFIELGSDPTDFVALASKVDEALTALESHTHTVASFGESGPANGAPSVPIVLAPTGSTVLKAK